MSMTLKKWRHESELNSWPQRRKCPRGRDRAQKCGGKRVSYRVRSWGFPGTPHVTARFIHDANAESYIEAICGSAMVSASTNRVLMPHDLI